MEFLSARRYIVNASLCKMTGLLVYINMHIKFHICNSLPSGAKAYRKEMQIDDKLVYSQPIYALYYN